MILDIILWAIAIILCYILGCALGYCFVEFRNGNREEAVLAAGLDTGMIMFLVAVCIAPTV